MCHIGHPWPRKPLDVAAKRLLLAHLTPSCVVESAEGRAAFYGGLQKCLGANCMGGPVSGTSPGWVQTRLRVAQKKET